MGIPFWSSRAALPVFLLFNSRLLEVINHAILYAPPQKVELGACGCETMELNALSSAKGVEELFRVPVQTRFVGYMDCEHLTGWRSVRHVIVFRIVRNEPL
jgi:hypothetical protein